jgi:hypothetical protein
MFCYRHFFKTHGMKLHPRILDGIFLPSYRSYHEK